jgi:Tfp pilus assembly protein PilW
MLELIIAATIGFLALSAVALLSIYTVRSFAAISNYMELDKNSRNALDRLTQITREADGVLDWNSHSVALSYHKQRLSFDYAPDTKLLVMTETNGTKRTLLDHCDFLDFQIFQRNSVGGSYDQYPVTVNESAAKIVQVSWICSRSLIGSLINSESVQSAKIVIRKQ